MSSVSMIDGLRSGKDAAKLASSDLACSSVFHSGSTKGSKRFSS